MLTTLTATRYITPLREGGSLPAVVEASDQQLYVMKFVGAGQGAKALIAELIAGEIARACGLLVPELIFIELDPLLGRSEPNIEIRDLIQASVGLNLGLAYLENALNFNPLHNPPDPELASDIVWFDAFVTNVDRTARNVNMMIHQHKLWLIDHGAALYFHHSWDGYLERSRTPFAMIREHVLLPFADQIPESDAKLRPLLTTEVINEVVGLIPDVWLGDESAFATPQEHRAAYSQYLLNRLDASSVFVEEAQNARSKRA
ncbi:aminotransferase class I and II [Chloroflexi bacterium TSY]|nr:aminotransferase class I and II [Chloroflexi bacterium TSY]